MNTAYKIALCQMKVTDDKAQNLQRAGELVSEAAQNGARVVCLPEIWNAPYDMKKLKDYAEPEGGSSTELLRALAQRHKLILIGGSIPELDTESGKPLRVYNTSFVFDSTGAKIARHRKTHLFDVDIENGIRFKESEFFAPGDGTTTFDTDLGRMGLAICFDVRFPEMFREMTSAGAQVLFLPAAFNMTTGPAHWEILMKSRALDNQVYFAACSPARNPAASYAAWGHSCVATPWGDFCGAADMCETIVYATIDLDYLQKVRRELPIGNI